VWKENDKNDSKKESNFARQKLQDNQIEETDKKGRVCYKTKTRSR